MGARLAGASAAPPAHATVVFPSRTGVLIQQQEGQGTALLPWDLGAWLPS